MPRERPLVSVCLSTYNHEKYIAESIRAVLQQTMGDLELIVVDDESIDDTPRIIATFDDPRIVSIRKPNGGPSSAWNAALEVARGRFVAFLNGDDVCYPHRLAAQVAAYEQGPPRLLFSQSDFIDDDGDLIEGKHFLSASFVNPPTTRAGFVRRFFDGGNCVNAVTGFTERAVIGQERFNPLFYQMQDFDMWCRLLKRVGIEVIPDVTVSYRIRGGAGNLSAPSIGSARRTTNEFALILRQYFDNMPEEVIREAFADRLRSPGSTHPAALACEIAFLFETCPLPAGPALGLARLADLLADPAATACLKDDFNFGVQEYVRLLALREPYHVPRPVEGVPSYLTLDVGQGFDTRTRTQTSAHPTEGKFRLTFQVKTAKTVRAVRWDPLVGRLARVRLNGARWFDRAGNAHPINPADAEFSAGVLGNDGLWEFSSADPQVILPVDGRVRQVEVWGRWSALSAEMTTSRLNYRLAVAEERLAHARDCLAEQAGQIVALEDVVQDRDARLADLDRSFGWRSLCKARSALRRLAGLFAGRRSA